MGSGIAASKQNTLESTRHSAGHAFIFDVDGVLTGRGNQVPAELISSVAALIKENHPVAFNTGRDMAWVREKILEPLKLELGAISPLNAIFVAEKGAHVLRVDGGREEERIDTSLLPPKDLVERIKTYLVEKPGEYFFDDRKLCMVTIESSPSPECQARFKDAGARLKQDISALLERYFLDQGSTDASNWRVDQTQIALDLEHKDLGKDLGARKILQIWKELGITVAETHCFGDSVSDLKMDMACRQSDLVGRSVFHYVGPRISGSRDFVAEILRDEGIIDTRYASRGSDGTYAIIEGIRSQIALESTAELTEANFTVSYLDSNGTGLRVEGTPRKRGKLGASQEYVLLKDDERARFRAALNREKVFCGMDDLLQAREAYRVSKDGGDSGQIEQSRQNYEKLRREYREALAGKIGFRHISIDGETIKAQASLVLVPAYRLFSNFEARPELIQLGRLSGTAMILSTADNKIIVQTRSKNNRMYGGVPGASVAGLLDAQITEESFKQQMPTEINTETVLHNIFKEAFEEIGLDQPELLDVKISGFGTDKVQIHDEFLITSKTPLTYDQVCQKADRNKNKSEWHFSENFVGIPASPEAIKTLLSEVKCPLPPSHTAAFIAAGFSMIREREGLSAAKTWKTELVEGIAENYRAINLLVENHYHQNPELLSKPAPNKPPRRANGYSAAYLPEEQGLPELRAELIRVGLISAHKA